MDDVPMMDQHFSSLDEETERRASHLARALYHHPYRISQPWLARRHFSAVVLPDYPTPELAGSMVTYLGRLRVSFCISCTFKARDVPSDFSGFAPNEFSFSSLPSRYFSALALVFDESEHFALLLADDCTVVAGPEFALSAMIGETVASASARLAEKIEGDRQVGNGLVEDVRYYNGLQRSLMNI